MIVKRATIPTRSQVQYPKECSVYDGDLSVPTHWLGLISSVMQNILCQNIVSPEMQNSLRFLQVLTLLLRKHEPSGNTLLEALHRAYADDWAGDLTSIPR